jgi:Domain of unknown function (DUF4157)
MSDRATTQATVGFSPAISQTSGVLQRKCAACGNHTIAGGQCQECGKKRLQTKLQVNELGDVYEQEADRIADQVMSTPAHPAVRGAPPRIQRFSGQSNGQMDAAPASVDQALASPGRPLEPALRQDMGQRFGHDFSSVRVHSGAAAEQSARDVNANAYTVGHDIVFGAGRFAPRTHEGRRLLAHELTHVVQQSQIPSLIQRQEGALLAFQADMEQRRKRVESLEKTGKASIGLFDDGKGKISGYQLTQNFALKLKNDARATDYALVQWIKGEISQTTPQGKAYWPADAAGALFGRSAKEPWLFKDWIIDSPDADPRFGSHHGLTIQVPTTNFGDSPGIIAKQALPVGLRYQVDARMGVYPWGARIPTTITEWESMRPTPFKEVMWGWDITIKPDQASLDINFK